MTITIQANTLRGVIAPLYNRYPRQTKAQPAYVELSEDGIVTADSDGEIGGGIPFSVYHGRSIRFSVSERSRGDALADLLESDEVVALFERVYQGHSVIWDGNNNVGKLNDDAKEAEAELSSRLSEFSEDESNTSAVWLVDEWLGNLSFDENWGAGKTLAEAVQAIEDLAEKELIELDGDVEKYLLNCAQHENERGKCFRPEVLAALHADGRHPVGEDDEEWKPATVA